MPRLTIKPKPEGLALHLWQDGAGYWRWLEKTWSLPTSSREGLLLSRNCVNKADRKNLFHFFPPFACSISASCYHGICSVNKRESNLAWHQLSWIKNSKSKVVWWPMGSRWSVPGSPQYIALAARPDPAHIQPIFLASMRLKKRNGLKTGLKFQRVWRDTEAKGIFKLKDVVKLFANRANFSFGPGRNSSHSWLISCVWHFCGDLTSTGLDTQSYYDFWKNVCLCIE